MSSRLVQQQLFLGLCHISRQTLAVVIYSDPVLLISMCLAALLCNQRRQKETVTPAETLFLLFCANFPGPSTTLVAPHSDLGGLLKRKMIILDYELNP